MIDLRLPKAFELLLAWHGLFAGAYTVAYLTAESAEGSAGLHQFAGYGLIALLALRLLAAALAPARSPWSLPWPQAALWRNFLRKLAAGDGAALRNRTPLAPLSGLAILGTLVLVGLSGLAAEWWRWDDLHEGLSEGSLAVVLVHVAIVSFGPALKRLGGPRVQTAEARGA